MEEHVLVTEFATPQRSEEEEITRQHELFANSEQFSSFADFIPDPVLVLNQNRQIVFANPAALKAIETVTSADAAGLRPGEALRCKHALAAMCGCGTSTFCRYCGAVKAILSSLNGAEDAEECLLAQESGETLLFMCYSHPVQMDDETFSLFILKDITSERRMQVLEHVFFHDIKNLLTALTGWVDLLKNVDDPEHAREISGVLEQVASDLVDEVNAQEQVIGAQSSHLATQVSAVDTLSILKELEAMYKTNDVAADRSIAIHAGADSALMRTDASLLKRVLGNMLRNALEAVPRGQTVTMGCSSTDGVVRFWVHNPGFIPPEVQAQIFKLSFSTKGKGRGLGTYSMRLLSERYLCGRVSFTSTPRDGTTFEAVYPLNS